MDKIVVFLLAGLTNGSVYGLIGLSLSSTSVGGAFAAERQDMLLLFEAIVYAGSVYGCMIWSTRLSRAMISSRSLMTTRSASYSFLMLSRSRPVSW